MKIFIKSNDNDQIQKQDLTEHPNQDIDNNTYIILNMILNA